MRRGTIRMRQDCISGDKKKRKTEKSMYETVRAAEIRSHLGYIIHMGHKKELKNIQT